MMIHPSYKEMITAVNSEVEDGTVPVVSSRYSIVMATAKRARQLQNQPEQLAGRKPVTAAVEELYNDELVIEPPKEYYQSQN